MPKGNVVITKSMYKKLTDEFANKYGNDLGKQIIDTFKEITDFDETAITYDPVRHKQTVKMKKEFIRDFRLHEYRLKKELEAAF